MQFQESQPSAAPETPAPATSDATPAPPEKKAKTEEAPAASSAADDPNSNLFLDESFVKNFLGTLPGVDVNDPKIQDALKSAGADGEGTEEDKEKKKKEEEEKKDKKQ